MRLLFLFTTFCMLLTSCNTIKHATQQKKSSNYKTSSSKTTKTVIKEAKKYLGTPYKYGGNNSKGIDCSALVVNAFKAINYNMPRVSREQANEGKSIKLKNVRIGDLLFFNTSGSRISHVGIVEDIKGDEIFFIHASTSKGVMVSSLKSSYWSKRFVKATRVL